MNEETRTKMVVLEMACSCGARFWCEFPVAIAPHYASEFIRLGNNWAAHHAHHNASEKK